MQVVSVYRRGEDVAEREILATHKGNRREKTMNNLSNSPTTTTTNGPLKNQLTPLYNTPICAAFSTCIVFPSNNVSHDSRGKVVFYWRSDTHILTMNSGVGRNTCGPFSRQGQNIVGNYLVSDYPVITTPTPGKNYPRAILNTAVLGTLWRLSESYLSIFQTGYRNTKIP